MFGYSFGSPVHARRLLPLQEVTPVTLLVTLAGLGESPHPRNVSDMRPEIPPTSTFQLATEQEATFLPRLGLGPIGIALRVLVAIAILVIANLATMLVSMVFSSIPMFRDLGSQMSWASVALYAALASVTLLTALLLVWVWLRFVERRRLADIGLRFTRSSLLWLITGTIAAALIMLIVTAVLPSRGDAPTPEFIAEQGPFALIVIAMLIPAFIVQGFPEELIFRGMLMSSMRAHPVRAVTVSTIAFTIIHLVSNGWQETVLDRFLYLVLPFGFGLFAAALLVWTRSLWAAVGVHGGMHLGNGFAELLAPTDPALTTTVAGIVYTVLGVLILIPLLARQRAMPRDANEWK